MRRCRFGSMGTVKADTDFDGKVWVERILHGQWPSLPCLPVTPAYSSISASVLLLEKFTFTGLGLCFDPRFVLHADTLSVLNQPEWPVAGLFLERFLLLLKSDRGLDSSTTAVRQVQEG